MSLYYIILNSSPRGCRRASASQTMRTIVLQFRLRQPRHGHSPLYPLPNSLWTVMPENRTGLACTLARVKLPKPICVVASLAPCDVAVVASARLISLRVADGDGEPFGLYSNILKPERNDLAQA